MGSADSVQVVRNIAAEYQEFECQPFAFVEMSEILPLFQRHDNEIDMWVLPGRTACLIAQEWGGVVKPMFHMPYKGASLYKTLCEIFYTQVVRLTEISFDSVLYEDLKRVFLEMGIDAEPSYVKPFEIGMTEDAALKYHCDLWRSGKTKVAVTCYPEVKKRLMELGIPAYRVLPARSAVESVLNLILRTAEMQTAQEAQIAVQLLEVDAFSSTKEFQSTDELFAMEMKVTQKLIVYAKIVQGALKTAGSGRFAIFTTRGSMKNLTVDFSTIPDLASFEHLNANVVASGIGIGSSAYEAEFNATKALMAAKEIGRGTWMVYFENKTVVGPLGTTEQITYGYSSERFRNISKRTSVSVPTLSRLSSVWHKLGKSGINAQELALHLQILPRSARRILQELERVGLAEMIGEESPSLRGRPRKRYKINLERE
jgi:hypothetical protein